MSKPAQKCGRNAISKQHFTLSVLFAWKMAYSFCFSWGKFRFPPKTFYNINCCSGLCCLSFLSDVIQRSLSDWSKVLHNMCMVNGSCICCPRPIECTYQNKQILYHLKLSQEVPKCLYCWLLLFWFFWVSGGGWPAKGCQTSIQEAPMDCPS